MVAEKNKRYFKWLGLLWDVGVYLSIKIENIGSENNLSFFIIRVQFCSSCPYLNFHRVGFFLLK